MAGVALARGHRLEAIGVIGHIDEYSHLLSAMVAV